MTSDTAPRNAHGDPHAVARRARSVEVREGPFRGLRGVVEEFGQHDRLILRIGILGRAVSLEIEAGLLDVVE